MSLFRHDKDKAYCDDDCPCWQCRIGYNKERLYDDSTSGNATLFWIVIVVLGLQMIPLGFDYYFAWSYPHCECLDK